MNPQAVAAIASAVTPFLTSPRPPSQEQVNQAFALTEAANRRNWMLAGGVVGAALLVYFVAGRD